jgi:aminopeptidase N
MRCLFTLSIITITLFSTCCFGQGNFGGNVTSTYGRTFTGADSLQGELTRLRSCFNVTFYHLDISIDVDKHFIQGSNLTRFKTVEAFQKMQVDLYANMVIDSIVYRSGKLKYFREENAVFIDFAEVLTKDHEYEVLIYYHGVPKAPNYNIPMDGGVLWAMDSLGNTWAQVVCQGSGASLWWPNKDHLSDEPDSMKISITVPSGYDEISNGRLLRKTPLPNNKTRFEWRVSYPINNYNVTFNIGKYAHFSEVFVGDDSVTVDYYVMPYNLARARVMFGKQVPRMLRTFEKYFGPYPFKKDGFKILESLYPMEHQSDVCIGKIDQYTNVDVNPLMWHESAHEWWGNSVSCTDMAELWIHEAFATYAEVLVEEDWLGKEEAGYALSDQANAVKAQTPVTGCYDVNDIHYDISDMYSKGSLMIHTFRNVLNDDSLFINLLRSIQRDFRYRTITAKELMEYINHCAKKDYAYLFDQYLHYTDIPTLEIQMTEQKANLEIKYRWLANVKNFTMPVKVSLAKNKSGFIYPVSEWKKLLLKNMSSDDFQVNEDDFYINTNITNQN